MFSQKPSITIQPKTKVECEQAPSTSKFNPRLFVFHEAWTINKVHVFGLSPHDYEALSYNMAAVTRAVEQLKARNEYYEGCIKSFNERQNNE